MRITNVQSFLMQAGSPSETAWSTAGLSSKGARHWAFVRVDTDAGIHGVGEGSGWPKLVATAISDLAPLLIGEDARHIDKLWHKLFVAQGGHGMTGVVGAGALSAIDIALWDLNAKALGVPVWQMLGGRFREIVPAYVHASGIETAQAAVSQGFTAVKTGGIADGVGKALALRDALDPVVDVALDLHGPPWLTAADAIRAARALEGADLLFLEEPVNPHDLGGLRRVRDATSLPLAAGERSALLWGYTTLIGERLVDVVQPDTGRAGGLTQLRKIAALAEAHGVMVAPHAGTLGPIAEYAAVHLMASIPNALMMERYLSDWDGRERVASPAMVVDGGHLQVPDRPGLGVDLDLEFIAANPPTTNVTRPSSHSNSGYFEGTADERLFVQARRGKSRNFAPLETTIDAAL